jgi:regulator of protease activity HflC (stomatin/prohibitin superfamily)
MELLIAAIVLLLAGVAVLIFRQQIIVQHRPVSPGVGYLLLGVGLLAGVASTIAIVPSGHVGVRVLFGEVQPGYLDEGLKVINPLMDVQKLSVRTQEYTMSGVTQEGDVKRDDSIPVLSKDGLELTLDVTVTYKLIAEDAAWVYQKLGPDYTQKIIRPAVRTAIREAASEFDSAKAYAEKRMELAERTQQILLDRLNTILTKSDTDNAGLKLNKQAFVIQQVLLRNVILPQRQRQAIETKLAMEQEALQKEYEIQREEKEKIRKRIEGEGIAERMAAIKKELTPEYLRFKGIEATMDISTSRNAKVVIIGGGDDGLPVILNADE